jgi:protein involved in ribonucleotide reduction
MPFIKLQFKPGVNRDQTNYSGEGGWWASDKIRFRSGYPEKIGGWLRSAPEAFVGYCRQLWNWITTYSDDMLAMGTNVKVYIEIGGNLFDITPLRAVDPTLSSPTTNNCINTTNGQAVITIDLGATAHGASTGDYVTVSGVAGTTIGGIPVSEIDGDHEITYINDFKFSFTTTTAATSTVTSSGGTAIELSFQISPGYPITVGGYGWGVGTWGRGAWGTGALMPIFFEQRDWWFDNFDNDLVMNIRNGPGYWWRRGTNSDPGSALDTPAILLSTYATEEGFSANAVPAQIMQLLVSQQDRHLIAFGAVPFGSTNPDDFDPMLIRWADQDTPGDWTPTTTNSAGDLRVSRGSRIIRALPTRQEILVWTDTNLYTLQFLGTTDVFSLQEYADNTSIMSPRAVASASNITYWMGQDKFYAYTGRVETLPCTVRDHVFNNINLNQAMQVICGTNEQWNEVWWFYPTAQSDYNDAYVVYNHLERIWYYGDMPRTAWLDTALRHYPQATNTPTDTNSGILYIQEYGLDADGEPMESYIQSNDFDLDDGDNFMLTRRIIPDVILHDSVATSPSVTLELSHRNFPGGALQGGSEDNAQVIRTTVDTYTQQVFIRARARQMALKVTSTDLGVQWQLGAPRLDGRPDGRR